MPGIRFQTLEQGGPMPPWFCIATPACWHCWPPGSCFLWFYVQKISRRIISGLLWDSLGLFGFYFTTIRDLFSARTLDRWIRRPRKPPPQSLKLYNTKIWRAKKATCSIIKTWLPWEFQQAGLFLININPASLLIKHSTERKKISKAPELALP